MIDKNLLPFDTKTQIIKHISTLVKVSWIYIHQIRRNRELAGIKTVAATL